MRADCDPRAQKQSAMNTEEEDWTMLTTDWPATLPECVSCYNEFHERAAMKGQPRGGSRQGGREENVAQDLTGSSPKKSSLTQRIAEKTPGMLV